MNTMKWLLKREFWEHKGGLLWAPAVIAALMLSVAIISVVFGANHVSNSMKVNGVQITSVADQVSPETQVEIAKGIASSFIGTGMALFVTMSFVVFFYLIASLYDDRSNRSVLFWKSLPISDRDTVLSKIITALLVAPLLTWAIATVTSFGISLIACVGMSLAGIHLFGAVLSSSHFYTLPLEFLACLPVYMLWALPTVGWLLMVSAWSKTKPFLWAVGMPLLSALLLVWAKALFNLSVDAGWYMQNIISRILVSILPGSWMFQLGEPQHFQPNDLGHGALISSAWPVLQTPQLWIGAVAGIAMIMVAIRLRRFRDEG